MPPKYQKSDNPDSWWQNAWQGREDISVTYEYTLGKDTLVPNAQFKVKNKTGTFKFRCHAVNNALGVEWVDCIDADTGEWRAFRPEQIRSVVKPKRRKANAK